MTVKHTSVVLILALSCLEGITAAAFSNVVVQRGPVDYINYNPSALSFNVPQLAQLTSGALEQVISLPAIPPVVSPCGSPCVLPDGPVTAVAALSSPTNAKIISYKPPNVPIFVANNDEPRGYTYAYAVFDDETGDKKTQSEHSDGSVVQGQYSFIQPDGFRRVVVYTADDLKGFNAVVKNISPEPEQPKEETPESNMEVKPLPPCAENKNEHLTDATNDGSTEESQSEAEQMEENKTEETITTEKNIVETEEEGEKSENPPADDKTASPVDVRENVDQDINIPNGVVSYNDVINCLQAKLQGARNVVSPLTYVLIPSSKSPC